MEWYNGALEPLEEQADDLPIYYTSQLCALVRKGPRQALPMVLVEQADHLSVERKDGRSSGQRNEPAAREVSW